MLLAHSDSAVVPAPSDSSRAGAGAAAVAVLLRAVLAVGPLLGLLLVLDEAGLLRRAVVPAPSSAAAASVGGEGGGHADGEGAGGEQASDLRSLDVADMSLLWRGSLRLRLARDSSDPHKRR